METQPDLTAEAIHRRIDDLPPEKRQALERLLQRERIAGVHRAIPRLARPSGVAPLSDAQRSLWIIDQLDPGSQAYVVAIARRLRGPLSAPLLEQALNALIHRHEILRTTFALVDGEPVQVIADAATLTMPVVDLRPLPAAERGAAAAQRRQEAARRPFDLRAGPLFRAVLFRLADDEHDLLITAHHTVMDGWSVGVLFQELVALYTGAMYGKPAPLPELPLQYADFAAWQRELLRGEPRQRLLAYWRERMAGAPPILDLPTDLPRPTSPHWPCRDAYFTVPAQVTDRLRALSRRQGTTLYMTLLAAFYVLLSRYSGQEDVVVGTNVSTRNRSELEGLIGHFVNTLALRADLSGDPSFLVLLDRVRAMAQGAFAHQELPFEQLVDELRPERTFAYPPLFQVLFVLQNSPTAELTFPEISVERLDVEPTAAKFDISVELEELPGGLRGRVEYRTDLFEGAAVARLWESYLALLGGIAADPGRRLSALPLLAAADEQQLAAWNATERPYDLALPVHARIAAQAARTPDAVAVAFAGESLTYRELDQQAARLARVLAARGVGPGALVGVCLERSLALVPALLGVLRAGGAYVPLDPGYPAERLAYMLEDARPAALLCDAVTRERLPATAAAVVDLDAPEPEPDGAAAADESVPLPMVRPGDLAYVIYTSGSTGRPKGVGVPHGALANFLLAMQERLGLGPGDTLLAVTTLAFDIAALELFLPLTVGAQVVVASRAVGQDGAALAGALAAGITHLQATPATWRVLLAAGWAGTPGLTALCGGEALPADLAQALGARTAALWNLYGPTEATVWATAQRVERAALADGPAGGPAAGAAVSIGAPLGNTHCAILDRHGRLLPVGAAGELYLGGVQVARGYLGRPALTAEKFVPDPDALEPGARRYRTGDRARWLADGTIEYLGRLDQQVKLRGFRIELGELEAALRAQPGVAQAAAALREDWPGQPRLVAYVVGRAGAPPPPADALRAGLAAGLPPYMLPAAVVPLAALPLTPNGKLDRKALPAPDGQRPSLAAAFVAPRTDLEQRIAAVWREVLGLDRVGMDDNFFDLGGTSFLLIQVHNRLLDVLRREVSVTELFQYPTIRALTAHLIDQGPDRPAVAQGRLRAQRYREAMSLRQPVAPGGSDGRE